MLLPIAREWQPDLVIVSGGPTKCVCVSGPRERGGVTACGGGGAMDMLSIGGICEAMSCSGLLFFLAKFGGINYFAHPHTSLRGCVSLSACACDLCQLVLTQQGEIRSAASTSHPMVIET